ncbi:MAG: magnesium transporter [Candidatus Bathyarchaeota archaeon]|nr:magnesium transporter [Candidatus Bathyarchaeum tardum]WGM89699.1 MAG: magnesium transporter [Candidatus Bathyarchaeum tardum]WNZ30203.1 MAG: magnesium transporter [Candidatus Bathyarchaeota archaeon]
MSLANIWQSFSKHAVSMELLKETFIALSFNLGGILAGFIVAFQFNVFELAPWAIAVYPVVLSARGVVSGLYSGRLSTGLHLGTIYPKLRGNTKEFYTLLKSIIVLTLETSIIMSMFSIIIGSLFWGITFLDFFDILMVVSATMFLGLINSLFTILFAFTSFKRGLDTDVIVYPIMSTTADITVTLSYVFILNLFFMFNIVGKSVVFSLGLILSIVALIFLRNCIHNKDFIKTIKESFVTLFFVAIIVNITGTILKDVEKIVNSRKEIYTVYPALIDTVGDVGSIVGSTATTKLALGLLSPSFRSIFSHSKRIVTTWIASLIMFTLYAVISLSIQGSLMLQSFLNFLGLLVILNIISVLVIVIVSFSVAILTYRRGLDPDNFVIPIESSLADTITTLALLIALILMNYSI